MAASERRKEENKRYSIYRHSTEKVETSTLSASTYFWTYGISGKKQSTFLGIVLNQMCLACVQLHTIKEGVELFEETKCVLEQECG